MRCENIEMEIQNRLNHGANVWVVGDVHGYFATFNTLIENLKLELDDCVILLGDMIDRGPTSANVINYVRSNRNFFCVRGNHEQMMIEGFDADLFFKEKDIDSQIWYHNGGVNTEYSYVKLYGDGDDSALDAASIDVQWMKELPSEIVLDKWRLVHGGYNPNIDVEDQSEVVHMNIRSKFYTSKKALDPSRTILFGHSPTAIHLHKDDSKAGLAWESNILTDDNRPMAIGIDTCLYHGLDAKVLTAYNLKNSEIFYQKLQAEK